jgi:uncharacterized protein
VNPVDVRLLVLAKEPLPGRVKTRLCPPCSHEEAAAIAEAALGDTLLAVSGTRTAERVLVLDGTPDLSWPVTRVVAQRGSGLDQRLVSAFDDCGGPALLIGMDTPQVTTDQINSAITALCSTETDAVLGPTFDGGYWAIGLRRVDPEVFLGIPMSTSSTFDRQLKRFASLGLRASLLPMLVDVDHFDDAISVASEVPYGRFAAAVRRVVSRLEMVG